MEDPSGTREPRTRPRDPNRPPRPDRDRRPERQQDRHPERPRDGAGDRRREKRGGERRDRERERERERDPHQDRLNPLRGCICPRTRGLHGRMWNTTSQRLKDSWTATNANTCARGEVWCR
uniref:MARVEL domain containing 3 n=1 Tax=Pipistrellus kuhlii TaxID=59472 RepID=A0A7J7V0M9_PIPKU|nr:MARVEL domain containing 3 [Pipistrellus kuhlii]